jgi:pimeloyl-ACP methyl ester carboxylesterase
MTAPSSRLVTQLADALTGLRPLAEQLPQPLPIVLPAGWFEAAGSELLAPARVLTEIADRVGVRIAATDASSRIPAGPVFDRVVADELALTSEHEAALRLPAAHLPAVLAQAGRAATAGFDRFRVPGDVPARDGTRLQVYAAGDPAAPPVVIASAVGVPARACSRWLELLSEDFFVLTWESRGLFGKVPDFDALEIDTAAQAGDLIAVLDHFGLNRAHVMGFCGGCVIALAAAAGHPDRVSSLSLWHGAYELGPDTPKTDHHRNIQALMAMAAESRDTAASVYGVVVQTMADSTPPELAHLVLYPFASAELFYRYCRVNGAVTDVDVRPYLSIPHRTLVVTSETDDTAHPAGSRRVAQELTAARLQLEPEGDHLSLFSMKYRLGQLAQQYIGAHAELIAAG